MCAIYIGDRKETPVFKPFVYRQKSEFFIFVDVDR